VNRRKWVIREGPGRNLFRVLCQTRKEKGRGQGRRRGEKRGSVERNFDLRQGKKIAGSNKGRRVHEENLVSKE